MEDSTPDLGNVTSLSLAVAAPLTAALKVDGGGWIVVAAEGPRPFSLEGTVGRTATAACDGSRTNCRICDRSKETCDFHGVIKH